MEISYILKNRGLSGLINLGNTCYFNSIIQCLSNTTKLTWCLLNGKINNNKIKSRKEYIILHEYRKLLKAIWEDNCTINPISFAKAISLFYNNYCSGSQEDAQEILIAIIDLLHKSCSHEININISGNPKNKTDELMLLSMKRWKELFEKEYSFIINMFYGQYYSNITCNTCNNNSGTFDPYCYLSLPINKHDKTIYDCLNNFTNPEELNKDNQWLCDKCNKKSDSKKQIVLWKTPEILIISLKRFDMMGNKKNYMINMPIQNLNINQWTHGYDKNKSNYDLYAICNHIGGTRGGHYYAYCKNHNGKWYNYNDNRVSELKSDIITKNGYIFFYKKVY